MSFPGRFGLKSQFSTSGPPNNYALPQGKPTQESQFSGKLATINTCRRNHPAKINIISFAAFHLLLTDEVKISTILELSCFSHIVHRYFRNVSENMEMKLSMTVHMMYMMISSLISFLIGPYT